MEIHDEAARRDSPAPLAALQAFPYSGLNGSPATPALMPPVAPVVVYYAPLIRPSIANVPAYVRVQVPDRAQVFFDGSPTAQTGTDRLFVSPPLEPSQPYRYQITARWLGNGRERTEERIITVMPGETSRVDFMPLALAAARPTGKGTGE
jgi:uncharacterized protein (TIGR03000 family)